MDGLSAAASVIAVTSLALQLAENTKNIVEFWDSIESAPRDVCDIRLELESLSQVLEQIGHEARHHPPCASTLSALKLCAEKIEVIKSITSDLETGLASSKTRIRKWSSVRAALSRQKVDRVQDLLGRMKATLTLLLLNDVRYGNTFYTEMDASVRKLRKDH